MYTSGMAGAENFPAGQGEGENPRGGAKERVNRLIQKFKKSSYIYGIYCYGDICSVL